MLCRKWNLVRLRLRLSVFFRMPPASCSVIDQNASSVRIYVRPPRAFTAPPDSNRGLSCAVRFATR
jgi:hypothetical protein